MNQLNDVPEVIDIIMSNLKSETLKQVSELNTYYHERYSNLFFAKRCLERNDNLSDTLEFSRQGNKVFMHFLDETKKETEALDSTKLRPSYTI